MARRACHVPVFSRSVVSDSFVTPWTVARQAALSMRFPRQEYWSGLPLPSPGDLPDSGIKPMSPALQVDSLLSKSTREDPDKHPPFSLLLVPLSSSTVAPDVTW